MNQPLGKNKRAEVSHEVVNQTLQIILSIHSEGHKLLLLQMIEPQLNNKSVSNMPQEYISTSKRAVMNMASLLSNPAASIVENFINVEIETTETTENPADTELETSLEPKPSTRKDLRFSENLPFWAQQDLTRYSETLNNEYIERIHQLSYSSLSDNEMLQIFSPSRVYESERV